MNMDVFFKKWKLYISIFVCFSVLLSLVFTSVLTDAYISLLLLPLIYFVVSSTYNRNIHSSENLFLFRLFLLAFFLRIIFVFVFAEILSDYIGIPFLSYRDDYLYDYAAREIVSRWNVSGFSFYDDIRFSSGYYSGYPNVSAFFMYIFGDSIYVPRLANGFFSALTCVYAYQICKTYSSEKEARLVALLFMVSPLLISYSSLQLKDTMLLFFTFGVIRSCVYIIQSRDLVQSGIYAVVFLSFIIFFRAATIPVLLGAFFIFYLLSLKWNNNSFGRRGIFVIPIVLLVFFAIWAYFVSIDGIGSSDDYFGTRYDALSTSKVSETSRIGASRLPVAQFIGMPLYLLFSLFLPPAVLVDLSNLETVNYTLLGLLVHFSLLPFLVVAFINILKYRKEIPIAFFILLVFVIFKVGQSSSILSILNPRQSLGGIYTMYLLFPVFFMKKDIPTIRKLTILISFMVLIAYNAVRLYSRGAF